MKEESEGRRPRLPALILWALNRIPLGWRIFFFERLGGLFYALDGRHRRIAHRNLALAFPEKEPKEREQIARSAFRNLGRVAAESTYIPRLKKEGVERYFFIEGLENLHRAAQKGKGLLIFGAHFGSWEWTAAAFPLLTGHRSHVLYRPLDSSLMDGIVERLRTETGNLTIPKQKAMGQILRLLKEGQIVGILLDQNMAWQEGVFVDFFGELACTNTGMALLALRTEAPVLSIFNFRQPDGRYRVVIGPEVPLFRSGDKEQDVIQNTQLFTRIIEEAIRSRPDHWLWVHQRWKTRPWQAKRLKGV